jgi:acyl carrier protein
MPSTLQNKEGHTVLNEAITDFVCEVYRSVLGIETVRPGDDFFNDLGGDSMSLAEVVSSIYDLLNVDIMEAMTTSTSPSSLALYIAPRLQQAGGQLRQPSTSVAPQSLVDAAKRVRELAGMNVMAIERC